MDEMTQAPQAPETAQQFDQPPIGAPPKERGTIRKIFNSSSWFVFFALAPLTVLIFLSQNSIPGDFFYPVKRGLEGVILAAASVSPSTRAAFRTDLTTRRFDEAEKLLLASSSVNGLKDFVTEIQAAQTEVSAISDPVKKQELQQKIQTSIAEYKKRLDAVKAQLVAQEEVNQLAFATSSQIEPTSKPGQPAIPTNTPVPIPTSTKPLMPSKPPTPTATPILPTNSSTQVQTQAPTAVPKQSLTPTQIPTPTLTPQPTPVPPVNHGGGTIGDVDEVSKYLDCLQNTPPPYGGCVAPEIESENSDSANQLEKQNEGKEKSKKSNESEKKDKDDGENKDNSDQNE